MASALGATEKTSNSNDEMQMPIVHLTTPMTLETGTKINVSCSSAIRLELNTGCDVTIVATTPVTLTASQKATLSPTAALGADFADGWNQLPEEIRIHILKFNLTPDRGSIRSEKSTKQFTLDGQLFAHLAMGSEIARLSSHTFYSLNTFQIQAKITKDWMMDFWLPPLIVRPLIKKIRIIVGFDEEYWVILRKFATGSLGFVNLKHVRVDFTWKFSPQDAFEEFVEESRDGLSEIAFPCAGRVEFISKPGTDTLQILGDCDLTSKITESYIDQLITFAN
jgi:hypothetical protein